MKTSIRIRPPSRWNRNYLAEALKKEGLEGEYTLGEIDINTEVLVTNHLSNKELEKLTKLKGLVIPTSGTEGIDIKGLKAKCIGICQDKSVISQGVVEYFLDNMNRLFEESLGEYFDKKNVGLLGFGNVGERIYEALKKYNCQFWILKNKPMKPLDKVVYCSGLGGLDRVLESCDIVVNTLPQSKETRGIMKNKTRLFKDGSVIVNLSRSGILDEKGILERIKKGTLGGAIFDTYPKEIDPLQYSNNRNIILTNHVAAIYGNNLERIAQSIINQVELFT